MSATMPTQALRLTVAGAEPESPLHPRVVLRKLAEGEAGSLRVLITLAIIWIIFAIAHDRFLTPINLTNLALQSVAVGTISVGVVLVLLLGEIDLSVGAVSGLCGRDRGLAVGEVRLGARSRRCWSASRAALAIGLFQGSVATRLAIPTFVVTLAGLLTWQGAQLKVLGDDRHAEHHRPDDHRPDVDVLLGRRGLDLGRGRDRVAGAGGAAAPAAAGAQGLPTESIALLVAAAARRRRRRSSPRSRS